MSKQGLSSLGLRSSSVPGNPSPETLPPPLARLVQARRAFFLHKATRIQSPFGPLRSARRDPRQEEALCRARCSPKTKDIREGRQPEPPPPHLGHAPCPLANSPQPHTLALCRLGTIRTRMVPGNGIRFEGAWGVGSASPPAPGGHRLPLRCLPSSHRPAKPAAGWAT